MKVTQIREVTFDNFYLNTKATFKGCKIPKREADYTSLNQYDEVSSEYWYGEDKKGKFVIRVSDHWVTIYGFGKNEKEQDCDRIASCSWNIKTNTQDKGYNIFFAGKAYLSDFSIKE